MRGNGYETSISTPAIAQVNVSVPLRGNGYETSVYKMICVDPEDPKVSVPLRGNGYETVETDIAERTYKPEGFRPLAGKWV